jgi:dihydrofolate reductase
MGKVIGGMTISLDGFINDRSGGVGRLYPDLDELRETDMLQEAIKATGAAVMGRKTYDMGGGDFTDYEFQVPIFVVTHDPPAVATQGENENLKFTFVTDGVESAIKRAKAAAGDKDVQIVGGANINQQGLKAGLIDELQVGIMPVLLGAGLRLFEHLESQEIELEKIKVIETVGGRTEIIFRVVK